MALRHLHFSREEKVVFVCIASNSPPTLYYRSWRWSFPRYATQEYLNIQRHAYMQSYAGYTHTAHTHTTCMHVCLHARTLMHAKLHVQRDIYIIEWCIIVDYIAMHSVHVDVQAGHTLAFLYQWGFYMQWLAFLGWGCSLHKLHRSESCDALQLQKFSLHDLRISVQPRLQCSPVSSRRSWLRKSSLSFTDSALAQAKDCTLLAPSLK